MVSNDEKNLALLSHVLCFFVGVIAPLIIWLLKKDSSHFVERHAKESINFQISLIIYYFVAGILCFLLIGFVILPIIGIAHFILLIVASLKAYNGESYKYPLTIRLVQ